MRLDSTRKAFAKRLDPSRRIVVMGVSGSGKSSLGEALGERLDVAYVDGDDYHPQTNIDKMSQGVPLDDEDRAGWLSELADLIQARRAEDRSLLLGCSALKHRYRERLRQGDPQLIFLFLDGSYELILERMQQRAHFFSPEMLRTQFDTLERPGAGEAVCVGIDGEFTVVVDNCADALRARCQAQADTPQR